MPVRNDEDVRSTEDIVADSSGWLRRACWKDWVQKGESAQLVRGEDRVLPSWGSACEGRRCMTFVG